MNLCTGTDPYVMTDHDLPSAGQGFRPIWLTQQVALNEIGCRALRLVIVLLDRYEARNRAKAAD